MRMAALFKWPHCSLVRGGAPLIMRGVVITSRRVSGIPVVIAPVFANKTMTSSIRSNSVASSCDLLRIASRELQMCICVLVVQFQRLHSTMASIVARVGVREPRRGRPLVGLSDVTRLTGPVEAGRDI